VALVAALLGYAPSAALAVEGSTAAGPIGGTDIRAAQLPPPGLYGGAVFLYAEAHQYLDGQGNVVLPDLDLTRKRVGPFLFYVPDVQVLGGSIAFAGIVPGGTECGRLVAVTPKRCISGVGDPYVEAMWSRYFGTPHKSRFGDAFPIAEGLTVALAFGMVIPSGKYSVLDATIQGLTLGNNLWDFAPIVAVTYITPPLIADGTELSAKLYWNNYQPNRLTHYASAQLVDIDFAVSEKIGRFQAGIAGFYAFQTQGDSIDGVAIPGDGHRGRVLELGGVLAYDMPEQVASMKIKALKTVIVENAVPSWGVALTVVKKLW
jgi:hypothetical protein